MITYSITSGPAVEPITTAQAKTHLRVDTADEDSYIAGLVTLARQWVEEMANLCLITQTVTEKFDNFPYNGGYLTLAKAPVQSITSITYVDTNGATQTWSSAAYETDLIQKPPRILPVYGGTYPSSRLQLSPITVTYVAGYGDEGTDVPEPIRHAMKLLIAELYEGRENNTQAPYTNKHNILEKMLYNYRIQSF